MTNATEEGSSASENHAQLLAGLANQGSLKQPRLVYDLWPEVGQMLGLTRNAPYAAAKRGEIPVIRIGKLIKVPKAAFERMLEAAGAR